MAKKITKAVWRRRRRRKRRIVKMLTFLCILLILTLTGLIVPKELLNRFSSNNIGKDAIIQTLSNGKVVKIDYLTPNPYSRPQKKLKRINGIVVHYTANPGTTAENNRSYFEGLAETHETSASSHYIIGLEGEIIQCIPLTEISYASNDKNDDTISIECCHTDETGEFNDATYDSLVSLVASLCKEFELDEKDIIRHYDVTGKLCPLYYVEHEDAWEKFKDKVMDEVDKVKNQNIE